MLRRLTLLALAFAVIPLALGQATPAFTFAPNVLIVGSGAQDLFISSGTYSSISSFSFRWNNQARPVTAGASKLSLTAADVATPGLAEVSVFNSTGLRIETAYIAIGYDVKPLATVYDPVSKRVYVATPPDSKDPSFPPNTVVSLDPETGVFGPSLSPGAQLGDMALSDDGSALYVILSADSMVQQIDPTKFVAVGSFRYRPAGSMGEFIGGGSVSSIAVMPGHSGTVALQYDPVVNAATTGTTQIAIFDNGTKRPNEAGPSPHNALLFSPDGKAVFAGSFGGGFTDTLSRFSVDSTGFPKQTPVPAIGGGPVSVTGGILYSSIGTGVDIQTMTTVVNLGVIGSVAVDAATQRVFSIYPQSLANASSYPEWLQAFDLPTQEPLGVQQIDTIAYFNVGRDRAVRLFRFGVDGIIYRSATNLLVFHSPLARPSPVISNATAIVNAASSVSGSISPGEIVSIYGLNLGPSPAQSFGVTTLGTVDPYVGNVQVSFGRFAGTVLFASGGQINVVAPFELPSGSNIQMQVVNSGLPSPRIPLVVAAAAPGIFTLNGSGKGPVALINQDGSVGTPAPAGSIVSLFATGGGPTVDSVDAQLARSAHSLIGDVHVFIDGQEAQVFYAGDAPGLVHGVFQINVQIRAGAAAKSSLPISIRVAGQDSAPGATIDIR